MLKRILLLFFLVLGFLPVIAQYSFKADSGHIQNLINRSEYYRARNDLDSAGLVLNQANQLNVRLNSQGLQYQIKIHTARVYFSRHPEADPKKLFMPLIANCEKTGDKRGERTAWGYLSECVKPSVKSFPFLLTCYENAMRLARELGDGPDEMSQLKVIADIHLNQRKFDLAEKELFQVINAPKKSGATVVLGANDLLTAVYANQGELNKALSSALKTVQIMQATGDSTWIMTYYGRLWAIYNDLHKPSSSLVWVKKALNHATIDRNHTFLFTCIDWTASELIADGKSKEALQFVLNETARFKPVTISDTRVVQRALGKCYKSLKKNDKAEKSFLEMIRLDKEGKDNVPANERESDYANLGKFYLDNGKYTEAKKYLTNALSIAEARGSLTSLVSIHLAIYEIEFVQGNYRLAINHLRLSNMLKDSIFTIAKDKQIEELEIKYKTAENKKDLDLARNKAKLEQTDLNHVQNTRKWITSGAVLLLIIAGLLYRQNRLVQKNSRATKQKNELLQQLILEKEKGNEIIDQKNKLLQKLVEEKEWLLKEVHHRVKNNLHIVMSLLESQSAFMNNKAALTAIVESQNRVRAIALIHQKLYGSANVVQVEMQDYIPELINYLAESFNIAGRKILIIQHIDRIRLDVSQAIPLGIILNEAITNAIKYAFNGQSGQIKIVMKEHDHRVLLSIADNGKGLPPDLDAQKPTSLGMTLIKGLTAQLEGEFIIEGHNGVKINIDFLKDESIHFNRYAMAED